MPIMSVSLGSDDISEMDSLQESLGVGGRSELVRAAIRMMASDQKEKSRLRGVVDCVLLIIHSDAHDRQFSSIRHRHEGIIRTQLHSHLKNHKCLEILVLSGASSAVKSIYRDLRADKKADYVKLVVP